MLKVGSVTFGNGTTWDHEVCDHMDSGNHTDVQNYCQSVSFDVSQVSKVKAQLFKYLVLYTYLQVPHSWAE